MHGNGILLCDMMTMMIWDEQRKTGSPRFWHGSFIGNATTLLQIPGAAWARHLDLSRPHLKMGERGLNYSKGERMAYHYLHYSSLRRYRTLTIWVKSFGLLEHFVLFFFFEYKYCKKTEMTCLAQPLLTKIAYRQKFLAF